MRSLILNPVLIISIILISGYLLCGYLLASNTVIWVLLFLPFFFIGLMPLLVWNHNLDRRPKLKSVLSQLAFGSMGLVSYLLVFALVRAAANALLPEQYAIGRFSALIAAVVAVAWGTYRALRGPVLREIEVVHDRLPQELDGFRIVQITDLHVGPSIKKAYVERMVEKANALKPDLIALTGDIGDGETKIYLNDADPLKRLTARHGIFYTPGNHEYYRDFHGWLSLFTSYGFHILLNANQRITVGDSVLSIAGVTDPAAVQTGLGAGPDLKKAFDSSSPNAFKILLSHRPGVAREADQVGFDFQISGHTHGGQFFPWTLITPLVHEFNLGLKRAGRMWIYVSSGTGSWGPLLRLGTTPELTLLILRSAKES